MLAVALFAMSPQALPQLPEAPFGVLEAVGAAAGTAEHLDFGLSVDFVGDLDGGGEVDLLVTFHREGIALVRGETGALLRTHGSLAQAPQVMAAALGDVDGDGVGDYAYLTYDFAGWVTLRAHSGLSGALHLERRLRMWNGGPWYLTVAGGADVDGDGAPDIAVSSSIGESSPGGPSNSGFVVVLSGTDGRQLYAWSGQVAQQRIGILTTLVPDVDGDGHAEIFYLSIDAVAGPCRAYLRSGADGSLLWTRPDVPHARAVCAPGDLDADGMPDLVLADDDGVRCLSGADGSVLRERDFGYYTTVSASAVVRAAGDLDGDGVPDLVVPRGEGMRLICGRTLRDLAICTPDVAVNHTRTIATWPGPAGASDLLVAFGRPSQSAGSIWSAGRVDLGRFRAGLRLDRGRFHVLHPQPIDWSIDFGAAFAGRPYFLIASTRGVGDTDFLGTRVPLDLGGAVMTLPVTLPVGVAARPGRLDANGGASGRLRFDGGQLLPYIGMHLWFSAVVPSLVQEGVASLAFPVLVMP